MTITRHVPVRAAGCTCVHAANLHTAQEHAHSTADGSAVRYGPLGCRVGWSGAGTPVPGPPPGRHWESGCPCIATGEATAPQAPVHA